MREPKQNWKNPLWWVFARIENGLDDRESDNYDTFEDFFDAMRGSAYDWSENADDDPTFYGYKASGDTHKVLDMRRKILKVSIRNPFFKSQRERFESLKEESMSRVKSIIEQLLEAGGFDVDPELYNDFKKSMRILKGDIIARIEIDNQLGRKDSDIRDLGMFTFQAQSAIKDIISIVDKDVAPELRSLIDRDTAKLLKSVGYSDIAYKPLSGTRHRGK